MNLSRLLKGAYVRKVIDTVTTRSGAKVRRCEQLVREPKLKSALVLAGKLAGWLASQRWPGSICSQGRTRGASRVKVFLKYLQVHLRHVKSCLNRTLSRLCMTSTNSLSGLVKGCFRLIGILTFLLGFLCALTVLDSEPLLAQSDRILGLSTRGMLLMVAASYMMLVYAFCINEWCNSFIRQQLFVAGG
jgi:hypothetical protein